MLNWLSNKVEHWARPANAEAHGFYAAIAEASRAPGFYNRFGVADSIDGRFDALVLHAVLVLRRVGGRRELAQGIIDTMFADLDLSLHEIGVGDTKIGKRVKIMARAFMGRKSVYIRALDEKNGTALGSALKRNLFRGQKGQAEALAVAVMDAANALSDIKDSALDADAVAAVLKRLSDA